MITTLSADGSLKFPDAFRDADELKPGQSCEIERIGRGDYRVRVTRLEDTPAKPRLIDVLRSCPVKDWWTEPDRIELTSLEPSRLFEE
jgi:bifunctional DNA-binding transcriptional regulator/antitoxin component of YhaV-PrlF toxin-antitoxin module